MRQRRDSSSTKTSEDDKNNRRLQSLYPLPSGLRANPKLKPSSNQQTQDRHRTQDEYFNSDEELETSADKPDDLDYLPAPGSPNADQSTSDDDSVDPLDAYMDTVIADANRDLKAVGMKKTELSKRQDIDEADDEETFYKWLEDNPDAGVSLEPDDEDDVDREIDYDDHGNIIAPEKSKLIDPLPEVDHDEIEYKNFNKNFYVEHEEIKALSSEQVSDLRIKLGILATGYDVPKPVVSFAHFGFDNQLMSLIQRSRFTQPTPIQAQAIPAVLSGRDVIGVSKTGSGKTCAFVWPALVHIMDQPNLGVDDGPIVLILVPTRELAQQIHTESRKFAKAYNISVSCAYGGSNMHDQILNCKSGTCEMIVSTPGRLIDLVKKKAVSLARVTYIVLDEVDRLFDMGFENQVRSIARNVRPDRQCLLFSATFRKKVERLCRDLLTDPVKITHSEGTDAANENITQIIEVFADGGDKFVWLLKHIDQFIEHGKLLIFVTRKENCETLAKNLNDQKIKVQMIHGDIVQYERDEAVRQFRHNAPILVATDVAARGLDIKSIKTVLNYDVARDINTHIHRIGRTARAGEKGFAYTLVTPKDKEFIPHILRNLEQSGQFVPPELNAIAQSVPWFADSRHRDTDAPRKLKVGGAGLGYRERPIQTQKVGPMADYRGAAVTVGHTLGPQSQRFSTLKSAFKNQLQTNFVAAQTDSKPLGVRSPLMPSGSKRELRDDGNSKGTRKRSRFAD